MLGDDGRGFSRIVALLAFAVLLMPVVAGAYSYGGGLYGLEGYFLPADAQISGTAGLIFGVILPFLIVAILLYIGLSQAPAIEDRQAQALAVLLALFIIPSGGYKVVAGILLTFFGFGVTVPGAPAVGQLPIVSELGLPIVAAVFAFVFMGLLFQWYGDQEYQTFEFISSLGVALVIYRGLGGQLVSINAFIGFIVLLGIGYSILHYGLGRGTQTGIFVALIGIFILGMALSTTGFLPDIVRGAGGLIQILSAIAIFGTTMVLVIIVILAILCVIKNAGGTLPVPLPFC